ncbi:hypothetical protein HS088_TW19G00022 [Tripterygium wilfordii]|uniref:Uncharacterized protein n=1 Tax=Tripterygium wilfordii TaxID=458696 RepID=A0A7J7C8G3_TRIWF|nr:uncharacterized protein At4g26450-like isoform X2 [Tripterygium wilfordii]KAF5730433.1 hypothetical protein HS088_TW19G00022 [Tripterygium wilfordii]
MHARHRSPGSGYRSGSVGMGLDGASLRGHGFYNSDHRSFNRGGGFGRGQAHLKSYHQQQPPLPPPQPHRKADIFMEAGRLAAEYMVSQGMLPPNTLAAKWQNGSLKNEFSSQEGDNLEGRTSALARLGSTGSDVGSGRRRYPDEFETRNYVKGRKRGRPHHGFGSDSSRDYGRSRSWSGRDKGEFVVEGGDDDNFSERRQEEQQGTKDVGNSFPGCSSVDSLAKGEEIGDAESGQEKHNSSKEMGSKLITSNVVKDIIHENDWPTSKVDGEVTNSSVVADETKDAASNDGLVKQVVLVDSPIQQCPPEAASSSKKGTDLLALCKFSKMPTKTRSSLTYSRNSKVDHVPNKKENNSDGETYVGSEVLVKDNSPEGSEVLVKDNSLEGSEVLVKDNSLDISPVAVQSDKPNHTEGPDLETSKQPSVHSVEDVGDLSPSYSVELGTCTRSPSFPDRGFMHEDNKVAGEGTSGLERTGIVNGERGEKRPNEYSDSREGSKKPKEWISFMVGKSDEYFQLSNLSNNKVYSQEEGPLSRFPESEVSVEYAQEKQLLPSSFKTCDLNLMEVSDMNESHHSDPMLIYPSIPEAKRKAAPIDVDLSISNSNLCGDYSMRTSDGKEIEVIDLDNDSAPEDKAFGNLQRKMEPVFPGLEGFSNNAANASDIPDVDDNYDGLLLSEYLNSFPNCAAIPEDINPMQNEMNLHNGEVPQKMGTLADDDSIYTSLGEIPLSFKGDASYSSFTDM